MNDMNVDEQIFPAIVLNPPMSVRRIRSIAELPILIDFLERNLIFGWDCETTPIRDFYHRRMRCMQFGTNTEQIFVDLLDIVGGDSNILRDCQGHYGRYLDPRLKALCDAIAPYLVTRKRQKVGVNLGFEYMCHYWLFGMRTQAFWDCMMVEKCIWAGAHSLKDYGFFSMAEMIGRYFQRHVDKALQSSFNLTEPLTEEQVFYAVLDTRLPLALKKAQEFIVDGVRKNALPKWFTAPPSNLCGDNLRSIAKIENDAIGSFTDMAVHGDCIDIPRWTKKIEQRKLDLIVSLAELDEAFIPYVGLKEGFAFSEAAIAEAEKKWKDIPLPKADHYEMILDEETGKEKKTPIYTEGDGIIVAHRKALNTIHGDMKKANTARRKLAEDSQGTALINYNSPKQLKEVLKKVEGLGKMKSTDADTLQKFETVPIIAALLKYRKIAKEISTYGMTWVEEWVNEVPNNKENDESGWINPHDHRLHPQYNQYDAETGRSSSSGPNGQNLPHDKETRACFIAGPPDEEIAHLKNSKCCGRRALPYVTPLGEAAAWQCTAAGCNKVLGIDEVEPESFVLLTIDMSGAELRIIAEQANEKIWIDAFNKGQDVHSICCELIDAEKWKSMTGVTGELVKNKKGEMVPLPECAFYKLDANGDMQKFKCECPKHNEYRNDFKPVNFGIAYGLGPGALSVQIKKDVDFCKEVLGKHKEALPVLWHFIDMSGQRAVKTLKAFDIFGRREVFREPTYEDALRFAAEHSETIVDEDTGETHIEKMTPKQALRALNGIIERAGKNMPIQSANASIIKLAMGSGYDSLKRPFLWHLFPKYNARLIKMIHDELVVRCYKSNAEEVAVVTADAIRRAAAERLHKVVMESEYHVESYWCK